MTITLVLATYVLGVMRLTRLATRDTITEPLRIWLLKKNPAVGYWANCPWCIGLWIAAATVVYPAVMLHLAWPIIVGLALSASYLTGMLAQLDREDIDIEVEQQ